MHETSDVMECREASTVQVQGMDVLVAWFDAGIRQGMQRWEVFVEGAFYTHVYESEHAYHIVKLDGKRHLLPKAGAFRDAKGYTSAQVDGWVARKWLED